MKKHMHGGRPQLLHDRVPMLISFERDRLREFEEHCNDVDISVSEGVRQLVEQELEKKAEGTCNPLNLKTNNMYVFNKEKPLQSDLTQWIETVHQHKQDNIMLTKIVSIGQAMVATANSYIRNNKRPYHR